MTDSFTDPKRHAKAQRRGGDAASTIEIGHEGVRNGFILRIDSVTSSQRLRAILERAFEIAGEMPKPMTWSAGWWAIMVGVAANEVARCELLRVPERFARHVVVRVPRSRSMLDNYPDWPDVRLAATRPWLDLRGPAALRHGPSDAELLRYGAGAGIDEPASELRRMFDLGVLEWSQAPADGQRWEVVHASLD